jgi:hypothetical protein
MFPFASCEASPALLAKCGMACTALRGAPSLDQVCPVIPRPSLEAVRVLRRIYPGATDGSESDLSVTSDFLARTPALHQARELRPETLHKYLAGAVRNYLVEQSRRRGASAPRGEAGFCVHAEKTTRGRVHCRVHRRDLAPTLPCKANGPDGDGRPCGHFKFASRLELPSPNERDWVDEVPAPEADGPEARYEQAERLAELRDALEALDGMKQLVFVRFFGLDGKPPESLLDIASQQALPYDTIQGLLRAARKEVLGRLAAAPTRPGHRS